MKGTTNGNGILSLSWNSFSFGGSQISKHLAVSKTERRRETIWHQMMEIELIKQRLEELTGLCGDNSCIFGPPKGLGTNGGCRCSRDIKVHQAVQLLRRVAKEHFDKIVDKEDNMPKKKRVKEIEKRLSKVPLKWKINRYLATFSFPHIDSMQPSQDYWKHHDEHQEFMEHAASDIKYLLKELDRISNLGG
jgi:hypothetical protein